jgi:ATP-dependent protease ClpP protease subunit
MKHRILNMTAPNGGQRKWYEIKNAAKDEASIYIYDVIAWYGVNASDFVRDLKAVDAKTINVHIKSPGGDVFEAWAIYQAIRSHKARVVVHIDGMAASAASVIALAGDEIRMGRGAFFMIHRPYVMAIGDADGLRETADVLQKAEGEIEALYVDKSNLSLEEVRAAMAEETWYSPAEAKAAGFVDMIVDGNDVIENRAGSEFLAMFKNAPDAVLRAAQAQARAADKPEPPKTVREFEDQLLGMGFSNAAARSIAETGFKASEPRDEDDAVVPVPEPRDEDGAAEVSSETMTALALLNARLATRRVARHN